MNRKAQTLFTLFAVVIIASATSITFASDVARRTLKPEDNDRLSSVLETNTQEKQEGALRDVTASTNSSHARSHTAVQSGTPKTGIPRTPIKHLIIIVQENHSFDNYFGSYPNAPGFNPLPGTPAVDGLPNGAENPGPTGQMYTPFTLLPNQSVVNDLPHDYFSMLHDYAGGQMSGFVQQDARFIQQRHLNGSFAEPMGHYDYRTIGPYWEYAQHYALADHWFQAVMGPTTTNVLYMVAARAGQNYHNAYYTTLPTRFDFTFPNIGDVMTAGHVSWMWYQGQWNTKRQKIMDNPFMFFRNYHLGAYQSHITDLSQFDTALQNGRLPSVTFLKPNGEDEHPGKNVQLGVQYVSQTINQIMDSKYWSSTAIILTYDESGGWYDHVVPPQTGLNVDGLAGDGPRVPTLIISPYAKANFVNHQVYDSTSILRFIEYNWSLPALNRKDRNANNLLAFFNFATPHFDPLIVRYQPGATITRTTVITMKKAGSPSQKASAIPEFTLSSVRKRTIQ